MPRAFWTHLVKDLRIEWRTQKTPSTPCCSSRCWSSCSFPSPSIRAGTSPEKLPGGVLCVATMFASVSALNQAWAREIRHQVMDAQRMAPAPGAELFLAKVLANFLFVTIVQIVLAPVFLVMYNLHVEGQAWLLAIVLPLGTWALVANGTFFAALSIRSRNRELLLPLILFPIFIPALLAMVQRHHRHPHRRQRPVPLDQAADGLRHHLHHRQPAALRRHLPCGIGVTISSFRWRLTICHRRKLETPQHEIGTLPGTPGHGSTEMKKLAIGLFAATTIALMFWGYYQAIYVAPDDAMQGYIFRIIYYHVPSASVAFLFFAISLLGSIGYLAFRRNYPERAQIADAWALAGAEVGVVFCTVVLTTGPLWGRRAWGIWWTWDARLTTTLVLGSFMSATCCCAASLPVRRCRRSPPCSASSARSMCPSSTCPTAGGVRSIPRPSSAAHPGSGMDPSMVGALLWNMLAWFCWGSARPPPALQRRTQTSAERRR